MCTVLFAVIAQYFTMCSKTSILYKKTSDNPCCRALARNLWKILNGNAERFIFHNNALHYQFLNKHMRFNEIVAILFLVWWWKALLQV